MQRLSSSILAAVLVLGIAGAAKAKTIEKAVRTTVSAVRYGKDGLALKYLDSMSQGAYLLGDHWKTGSSSQQSEFAKLFTELFAAIAFPKIRKDFEHLDTILYRKPKVSGKTAEIGSTIVILHALKKQEIETTYQMRNTNSGWKIVDVTVKGDKSMLTNIRDDQVQPLFKKGGWDELLNLMRARLKKAKG